MNNKMQGLISNVQANNTMVVVVPLAGIVLPRQVHSSGYRLLTGGPVSILMLPSLLHTDTPYIWWSCWNGWELLIYRVSRKTVPTWLFALLLASTHANCKSWDVFEKFKKFATR